MISVTEVAKEELKKLSLQVLEQPETVLRLVPNEQGQLGLVIDREREDDQVVKHEEATILVVDKELSTALEGIGIDYQDTPDGPRLALIRTEETTGQD